MTGLGGNLNVSHPREPWDAEARTLPVHTRLDILKGTDPSSRNHQKLYDAAKRAFDMQAALDLVDAIIHPEFVDTLAHWLAERDIVPRIVIPHPGFDDEDGIGVKEASGKGAINAIPFAYAAYLSETLDCPFDTGIVLAARIGRTKLGNWTRFLWQPSFCGPVVPGAKYLILDDVYTTGGTLAALRSYIIRNGGSVIAASTLAHKDGRGQQFAIADDTVNMLVSQCGEGFSAFWQEAIGHDPKCLTDAEGRFLVDWTNGLLREGCPGDQIFQRVRDRLIAAATKGS